MPKKGQKTDTSKCPICGAFLTPTTSQDYGGPINYYCKQCQRRGQ